MNISRGSYLSSACYTTCKSHLSTIILGNSTYSIQHRLNISEMTAESADEPKDMSSDNYMEDHYNQNEVQKSYIKIHSIMSPGKEPSAPIKGQSRESILKLSDNLPTVYAQRFLKKRKSRRETHANSRLGPTSQKKKKTKEGCGNGELEEGNEVRWPRSAPTASVPNNTKKMKKISEFIKLINNTCSSDWQTSNLALL